MSNIKAGDVVALQSDGDYMTVQRILENGKVQCVWFANGDVKFYEFAPVALKLIHIGKLN